MYEAIFNAIKQFGNFTQTDLDLFASKLQIKKNKKNSFILVPGNINSSFSFLLFGCIRHYTIAKEKELTLNLLIQCDWVFDDESFINQKPSENYLQATEDCELAEMSIHSLHELIAQSQAFLVLGKLLNFNAFKKNKFNNLIFPEEKYNFLLKERPEILQKFPLKHIASLIGITPETLSRIRRKALIS